MQCPVRFLSDAFSFVAWLFVKDKTLWLPVFHSAGVGRTGTFIVIDSMIDMMHMEQRVDVFGFVSRIREQRCQLIQTDVSADPFRPVVPWTDSSTRSLLSRHKQAEDAGNSRACDAKIAGNSLAN